MFSVTLRSTAVLLILALSACINLAPEYRRPAIDLPERWDGPEGQNAAAIDPQWWKIYGDEQLDRLVEEAIEYNADLVVAVARVDEARALLGETRSGQFPTVDANYSHDRTRSSLRSATPLPPGTERVNENYRATVNMSYELDLWGRLRNATTAARADLLATEAARNTVQITLVADVVKAFFALQALDEQVAATQRSVISRGESLALQELRYKHGVISEFEYRQLEAEVEAARAQLPALERSRAQQETALAVLLGRSPRAIYEGTVVERASSVVATTDETATEGSHNAVATSVSRGPADVQDAQMPRRPRMAESGLDPIGEPPVLVVPAGLPSELLLRRPDLVEAEQRLIAANARIGAARAAYFPSISLTGFLGSESTVLGDLFTAPADTAQAVASITQPIWNAGRVGGQVKAANARQRQALARYRQAIQNAFREVRDAIVAQIKTREQFDAEHRRVAALRDTLRLAKLRYESGLASQLNVLDAERNLLAAELNRSDALRAQRAAVADLLKALGGAWGAGAPPNGNARGRTD